MKKILVIISLFIGANTAFAQVMYHEKYFANIPVWIDMMADTNANYHTAIQAFEIYWANHAKPDGESDMDVKKSEKNKKRFSKREIKEARQEAYMRMQIKKFDWWKNKFEPFVKDDGTIITPSERLLINYNK